MKKLKMFRFIGFTLILMLISLSAYAGGGEREYKNRGRIQIQGGQVEDSEPWARNGDITTKEGLQLLHKVWNRLGKSEKKARILSLKCMEDYIKHGAESGGLYAPLSKSCPANPKKKGKNGKNDDNEMRIDLEVITGVAFAN